MSLMDDNYPNFLYNIQQDRKNYLDNLLNAFKGISSTSVYV